MARPTGLHSGMSQGQLWTESGVRIRLDGTAVPQGSKSARVRFNRVGQPFADLFDQNSRDLRPWRQLVKDKAALALRSRLASGDGGPFDGPLLLDVCFWMPMPESRPAAIRRRGWGWCSVKPDADKLVRAIGDGLTDGGLIADDARFVALIIRKAETTAAPCTMVTIRPVNPDLHPGDFP